MMFQDDQPKTTIMTLSDSHMQALRWLLKVTVQPDHKRYDVFGNMCVANDDMVCSDGIRLHMLSAEGFFPGDDHGALNLHDGVYRVVFAADGATAVFIPVKVKYPDYAPIVANSEKGKPGYSYVNPIFLADALSGMDAPAQLFIHADNAPMMIVGKISDIHAVAVIMPMGGD